MGIDRFGVLDHIRNVVVPGRFTISAVPEIEDVLQGLTEGSDSNNHVIFPDRCATAVIGYAYKLPSTHQIEGPLVSPDPEFRNGMGAFILGLLSVLYDCRLQWETLWHEGYVRSATSDRVHLAQFPGRDDFAVFFERAMAYWDSMDPIQLEWFLKALFYHQKANGYAHGFEAFYADYTTLEAVWHHGISMGYWEDDGNRHHGQRLHKIASRLGMIEGDHLHRKTDVCLDHRCNAIRNIYEDRNRLFHESLWSERRGILSGNLSLPARNIHQFTKRVLVACLGFRNGFTRSTWEPMDRVASSWP
jgi:hypothetical protein